MIQSAFSRIMTTMMAMTDGSSGDNDVIRFMSKLVLLRVGALQSIMICIKGD